MLKNHVHDHLQFPYLNTTSHQQNPFFSNPLNQQVTSFFPTIPMKINSTPSSMLDILRMLLPSLLVFRRLTKQVSEKFFQRSNIYLSLPPLKRLGVPAKLQRDDRLEKCSPFKCRGSFRVGEAKRDVF